MTEVKLGNIGCESFCLGGKVFKELAEEASPDQVTHLAQEATDYIALHPCKTVIEGNCRLVEFLIRKQLDLPLDKSRLEAIEKYYDRQEI